MKLGSAKNTIRMLQKEGKNEEALKMLMKFRMSVQQYEDVEDDLFINYCIAWFCFKANRIEMCKYYLQLNKFIFEDDYIKSVSLDEYIKWLWLNSEILKNEISKEQYTDNFTEIYNYYNSLEEDETTIRFKNAAIQNMIFINGTYEEKINFIYSMIKKHKRCQMVMDMIEDYKNISNDIYIELKTMLNSCDKQVVNI